MPATKRCDDPTCPCQDGDACHYEDCGDTKAWPSPPLVHAYGPGPRPVREGEVARCGHRRDGMASAASYSAPTCVVCAELSEAGD